MWKSKFYIAFVLNRRVVLHAIDATLARWRGDAGSSPLDGASTAASLMEELRERTSELLLRLARRLKKEKAKRVFLVNNYDLICSIFAERDVSAHESDVLFWLNKLHAEREAFVEDCGEIKILHRVRAESSRRPPRHRRDACSGRIVVHPSHWLISTQVRTEPRSDSKAYSFLFV